MRAVGERANAAAGADGADGAHTAVGPGGRVVGAEGAACAAGGVADGEVVRARFAESSCSSCWSSELWSAEKRCE